MIEKKEEINNVNTINTINAVNREPIEKVSELYDFMLSNGLEELEIKESKYFIRLKRRSKKSSKQNLFFPQYNLPAINNLSVQETVGAVKITSPLNGTFYRASSPTTLPFVKEGDIVESGAILCIIEAMKVMNEIKSDRKCKITKILIENGKPVMADQEIFEIQPI